MNICAVRTLLNSIELTRTGIAKSVLSHEPETVGDWLGADFIWPVDPYYCNKRMRVCKHCGSVYLLTPKSDDEQ